MSYFSESESDDDLLDERNVPVVWKLLLPFLHPDQAQANQEKLKLLVGKWFACVYTEPSTNSKRKADAQQLIFGPATPTLFSMEHGYHTLQINCCRPYDLEKKPITVEEYAKIGSDIWNFKISDIIAGPLDVTFLNNREWEIKNINSISDTFERCKSIDRHNIFMELYN